MRAGAALKLGLAAILLFGAFVALMAFSQDDLLFPTHAVAPADPLPQSAERLSVDLPGGERLHGVHIPPARSAEGDRLLVLGFGGNAWNGEMSRSTFTSCTRRPTSSLSTIAATGPRPAVRRPKLCSPMRPWCSTQRPLGSGRGAW